MSSSRPLPSTKFSSNPAHLDIISERLKIFKKNLKNLENLDFLEAPVAVIALFALWPTSMWQFFQVVLFEGLLYLKNEYQRAEHFEAPYQESLANLLECYIWYKKSSAPVIETGVLAELEKTVKLYVDAKYLPNEKVSNSSFLSFWRNAPSAKENTTETPDLQKICKDTIRFWRYGYQPPEQRDKGLTYRALKGLNVL